MVSPDSSRAASVALASISPHRARRFVDFVELRIQTSNHARIRCGRAREGRRSPRGYVARGPVRGGDSAWRCGFDTGTEVAKPDQAACGRNPAFARLHLGCPARPCATWFLESSPPRTVSVLRSSRTMACSAPLGAQQATHEPAADEWVGARLDPKKGKRSRILRQMQPRNAFPEPSRGARATYS